MIYLDNCSSTKVDELVLQSMMPFFSEHYANVASAQCDNHILTSLENAKESIAQYFHVDPLAIVFTSGATESINQALYSAYMQNKGFSKNIVTTKIEHSAVLEEIISLKHDHDANLVFLNIDKKGQIDLDNLKQLLEKGVGVLSLTYGNSELGTTLPLLEVCQMLQQYDTIFHLDVSQSIGEIDCNEVISSIDLISFSGHKFHGPKGIGGLIFKRKSGRVRLLPLIRGGGQQKGYRSGTLNIPGVIGMGKAIDLILKNRNEYQTQIMSLKTFLLDSLEKSKIRFSVNSDSRNCLTKTLNISIIGCKISSYALIKNIKGLYLSNTSACTVEKGLGSSVLRTLGLSEEQILGSLRFGLSRFNKKAEIEESVHLIEMEYLKNLP